ncbi:MAG: phosphohistidine phosphatase SixA [Acidobacteriota bacterium]|nr:phosphohistidine phosphatase SixA [Acidobacteriota bacterium]
MKLYLLRHAIAHERGAGQRDADRELTKEGREKLSAVLKIAARSGVTPSRILTSPYLRARQTAEIARDALGSEEALYETGTLTPESSPQMVWNELGDHRKEESLLLVSHDPLLSNLVPFLLNAPALQFHFRKAAIVAMEIGNFAGEPDALLEWVLTPKLAGQ